MLFKEFFNEEEGYALFLNLFHHLDDEHIVLVFCDWLTDNGFPETAKIILNRINNTPGAYWTRATDELEKNDMMFVSESRQYFIDFFGRDRNYRVKITPSEIQVAVENGRWEPAPEEIIKKTFPGLVLLIFANKSLNSKSHFDMISKGFYERLISRWTHISNLIIAPFGEIYYNLENTTIQQLITLINETKTFIDWIKGRSNVDISQFASYTEQLINAFGEEEPELTQLLQNLLQQITQ